MPCSYDFLYGKHENLGNRNVINILGNRFARVLFFVCFWPFKKKGNSKEPLNCEDTEIKSALHHSIMWFLVRFQAKLYCGELIQIRTFVYRKQPAKFRLPALTLTGKPRCIPLQTLATAILTKNMIFFYCDCCFKIKFDLIGPGH